MTFREAVATLDVMERAADRTSLKAPEAKPADWLVTGALLLVTEFKIWISPVFQTGLPGPRPALSLLGALAVIPLLWRRSAPLHTVIVMVVAVVLVGLVGDPELSGFSLVLALFIAVYSVASYGGRRAAFVGLATTLVGGVFFDQLTWVKGDALVDIIVPELLLSGWWVAGWEVNVLRARTAELGERTALLERAREHEARIAVSEERTRIARELHDVVSHSISIMGLHAAAARRALGKDPSVAEDSLLIVERTSRHAQDEMKRMLGMLRQDGSREDTAPIPALSRLPDLIEEVRGTGLNASLDVSGQERRLSRGLELSAYRIIQEALTNARRHGGDNVEVAIAYGRSALDLAIRDDGPGVTGEPGSGQGIIGMRERASLHGGELYAGNDDKGFLVKARLRIEAIE
jgi:signal transduction histidine kinase